MEQRTNIIIIHICIFLQDLHVIINDGVDFHRNATTNHMVSVIMLKYHIINDTVVYIHVHVCVLKINVTSSVNPYEFQYTFISTLPVHSYTKEVHVNVLVCTCKCIIIINIVVERT